MKYLTREEVAKIQSGCSPEELSGRKNTAYNSYLGKEAFLDFKINKITKYIPGKDAKILDTGCAGGAVTGTLHNLGYHNLYGNDLADFLTEENRERLKGFDILDLNYNGIRNKDIDAAFAWCVLPHLDNPHNLIREIHKSLKPSGLFFVSMPNIFSLSSRWIFMRHGDLPRYKAKKDHVSIFTKGVLETTLLKYFDLIERDFYIRTDTAYFKAAKWPEKILLIFRRLLPPRLKELIGYNIVYILRKR